MLTLTKQTYDNGGETITRWDGTCSVEMPDEITAQEVARHFLQVADGRDVIRSIYSCKDKDQLEMELEEWAACVTRWVQDNNGWLGAVVALREEIAEIKRDLELAFRCK